MHVHTVKLVSQTASLEIPFPLLWVHSNFVKNMPQDEPPKEIQVPFAASEKELTEFRDCLNPPFYKQPELSCKEAIKRLADFLDIEWLRQKSSDTLRDRLMSKKTSSYPPEIDQVFAKISQWLERVYNDGKKQATILIGGRVSGNVPHTHFPMKYNTVTQMMQNNCQLLKDVCYEVLGFNPDDIIEVKDGYSWKDTSIYFTIKFE